MCWVSTLAIIKLLSHLVRDLSNMKLTRILTKLESKKTFKNVLREIYIHTMAISLQNGILFFAILFFHIQNLHFTLPTFSLWIQNKFGIVLFYSYICEIPVPKNKAFKILHL